MESELSGFINKYLEEKKMFLEHSISTESCDDKFASLSERHLSLADLPRPEITGKKRITFASAGFYYDMKSLICFRCYGRIDRDYKGEDPWELHALLFSGCEFLKAEKGQRYIDEIASKYSVSHIPYYKILNAQLEAAFTAYKDIFQNCEEKKHKVAHFHLTTKRLKDELQGPRLKSGHRLQCEAIDTRYYGCGCFQYADACKEAIDEILSAVGGAYKLELD